MKRFPYLTRYLFSLAGVATVYLVYSLTVSPWIDGRPPERTNSVLIDPARLDSFDPQACFPEGSWEREKCKILRTRQGYLLFKDYQPHDDGRVDVFPVSMVVPAEVVQGMTSGSAPIILRAPAGAVLEFDRRVSIAGGFGKFRKGLLKGEIEIRREDPDLDPKDQFQILTREIRLQTERIHTEEAVSFRMGAHRGTGRQLTIQLSPSHRSRHNPSDSGVSDIRLEHVTRLIVDNLGAADVAASSAGSIIASTDSRGFEAAKFQVTCEGPLIYRVSENTLTLSDNVIAQRLDLDGDTLRGELLKLVFNQPAENADRNIAVKGQPNSSRGQDLKRMILTGKPARILIGSRDAFLQARTIDFDLNESLAHLTGPDLLLKHRQSQFQGRSIRYRIREDGSLGNTLAEGPGRLTKLADPSPSDEGLSRPFALDFSGRLTIKPDGNLKRISLLKRSVVTADSDTRMTADQLELWVLEQPVQPTNKNPAGRWKWAPHKLVAKGNVLIQNRELNGTVKMLTASWKNNPESRLDPSRIAKPVTNRGSGLPVSHQTLAGQRPNQPQAKQLFFDAGSMELNLTSDAQPRRLSGTHPVPSQLGFESILLRQSVQISDAPLDQESLADKSWRVHGGEVLVKPSGTSTGKRPLYHVRLSDSEGEVARLQTRDFLIVGNPIFYDQGASRVWVQGPGNIDLKTRSSIDSSFPIQQTDLNRLASSPNQPGPAAGNTDVKVNWLGGMIFDGKQIYFEHQVETQVERTRGQERSRSGTESAALTLVLDQPVNLSDPGRQRMAKSPEIEKLILANGKLLDQGTAVFRDFWPTSQRPVTGQIKIVNALLDSTGIPRSIQSIQVPSAIAFGFSGEVQARGPGKIEIWQPSKRHSDSAITGRIDPATVSSVLTYTQVKFDGSLKGNLKEKGLILTRNVRALHSPATSFQFKLDPDQVKSLSPDQVRLSCDRVDLNQWQPRGRQQAQVEMVADGNAFVQGQRFRARGKRIRYNQDGEQLVIEGSSPHFAELVHRKSPVEPPSKVVAEKFTYFVSNQTYQAENIKSSHTSVPDIHRRSRR